MTLPRGHVLDTLYKLNITIEHHGKEHLVDFISKDGVYACVLPEYVGGILLKTMCRALNINSFEFYKNITSKDH